MSSRGDSAATKVYLVGGMLMALLPLWRVWWNAVPGEDRMATGLSSVSAGLIVYPTILALGTLGLLLGLTQPQVEIDRRVRVALSLAYFIGAILFGIGLYYGIGGEEGWMIELSSTSSVGLGLIAVVLLVHITKFIAPGSRAEAARS